MPAEKTSLPKPNVLECDSDDAVRPEPLADYLARLKASLPPEDFATIRKPSEGYGW